MQELERKFKNPDNSFSPYCFWFLNDGFEKEHTVAMAREMERKGMSPGYLQDRGITENKFLTDGFFETIEAVIDNTEMPFGLCDDGGGMYGAGLLDTDIPRGVSLYWETAEETVPECFCAVSFAAENGIIKTGSIKTVQPGCKIPEGETVYAFHKYHARSRSGSEIDFLSEKTTDTVIERVYEKIKERLGKHFGSRISGIFMDIEGDFGYKLAYSDELKTTYEQMYGESFFEALPLLIAEDTGGTYMRARYRYYSAVAEVYSRFFGKISDWCRKNGVEFTGHTWEEKLYGQVLQEGDFYKIQKNFSVIGTDSLRLECFSPRDFMEARTIADRENKKFMCEAIGCAGWGLSPTELKRAVNCLTAWGVNHIVLHGIYSDRNLDRAGFAPDMYEDNPYWEYFGSISDYIRRASYINSLGGACADTVLYNPIDSIKALAGDMVFDRERDFNGYIVEQRDLLNCGHGLEMQRIEESYTQAIEELVNRRIQFYVYDEEYFETQSLEGIENIVIPSAAMMSEKLLKRLAELSAEGKSIYFIGAVPYALTEYGKALDRANELLAAIGNIKTELDIKPKIDIAGSSFKLRVSHRKQGTTHYIWMYNDSAQKQDTAVMLNGLSGRASLMSCENGEIKALYAVQKNGGTELRLHFDEFEGFWVMLEEEQLTELTDFEISGADKMLSDLDFTGSIVFKTAFVPKSLKRVRLAVDNIYHMAEVTVNGKSAGSRLWKPFEWDITELVTEGENTLEIRVGNLLCSSLKQHGERWQTGIHRRNCPTAYLSGIEGKAWLKTL